MKQHSMIRSLLIAALLLGCGDVEKAKAAARTYATDLGYKVVGVACTGTDTDGDGYMGCSVRVEGSDAPIALECESGGFGSFTQGCKVALPKLNVNRVGP